jgi:purine-binding chemotaxis protein CheW
MLPSRDQRELFLCHRENKIRPLHLPFLMPEAFVRAAADRSPALKTDGRAGKYLTFMIGKEEFGVGVLKVREIMGIQDITAMPRTPPWMKGVIDLRGRVIPIIDLRLKFGLPGIDYTERTCIVVVLVGSGSACLPMGIVVDEVSEVITMAPGDIEDTPDFGSNATTSWILGIARIKGGVKILLDIDEALTKQEIHGPEPYFGKGKA